MLLSKQNHKPVFGALLAFLFIFSIFFSFHPQNGAASTFFEGEGEGGGSSGADTERAPTTVLEICENLVDDDGDGLVDNQDAIDCPATTGQAPSLTPGPQVAPEQEEEAAALTPTPTPTPTPEAEEELTDEEEEAAEEELTDEEEEAAALTPTPTPTREAVEELTDEEEEAALSPDNSMTPAAEICDNTFDDDGDGLTDSEDSEDCPTAETPGEELTDEEEEAAALTPTPTPTPTPEVEEELTDEEEEAAEVALTEEEEEAAALTPTPTPTPEAEEELTDEEEEAVLSPDNSLTPAAEICDNTFDDDGDGLTDSEDSEDCPTAETPGEELTDEEEEAAALTPTPTPTPEAEEELTDEEEEAAEEELTDEEEEAAAL